MDEVIFHEHLEESSSSQTGNHCVQRMSVLLEVSNWHSLNKCLN